MSPPVQPAPFAFPIYVPTCLQFLAESECFFQLIRIPNVLTPPPLACKIASASALLLSQHFL